MLVIRAKLFIFARSKSYGRHTTFATSFAKASEVGEGYGGQRALLRQGYGGHGEIAQMVRAFDS
jgi:hypothetical protein